MSDKSENILLPAQFEGAAMSQLARDVVRRKPAANVWPDRVVFDFQVLRFIRPAGVRHFVLSCFDQDVTMPFARALFSICSHITFFRLSGASSVIVASGVGGGARFSASACDTKQCSAARRSPANTGALGLRCA
jgi:hypothetical protein